VSALPPRFRLKTELLGETGEISVQGELDLSCAPELDHALDDLNSRKVKIVLDLSDCTFIDSSGIALIILGSREAEAADGAGPAPPLIVCGLRGQVRRILQLTGVLDHIVAVDTREEALSSIGWKGS